MAPGTIVYTVDHASGMQLRRNCDVACDCHTVVRLCVWQLNLKFPRRRRRVRATPSDVYRACRSRMRHWVHCSGMRCELESALCARPAPFMVDCRRPRFFPFERAQHVDIFRWRQRAHRQVSNGDD